jgi:regulatory protein
MVKPNPPEEISAEAVKNLLLRKLARAPQPRAGLVSYLNRRSIPAEIYEPILQRFAEVKLIDDAEYAAMWVRTRRQIRGTGPAALRRELQQKGIADDLIEAAVGDRLGDDFDTALALAERKLRTAPARFLSAAGL